jgi:hypothetical protein
LDSVRAETGGAVSASLAEAETQAEAIHAAASAARAADAPVAAGSVESVLREDAVAALAAGAALPA